QGPPARSGARAGAASSAPAARRASGRVYRSPSNNPSCGCARARVLFPGTLARRDARERASRDGFTAVPGKSTRAGAHPQDTFSLALRALGAVLRPPLPAIVDARAVERPAHDVVAHARQVLHTAAADQHDRVLLK